MEQYATYADYVAAIEALGGVPIPKGEFEAAKKAETNLNLDTTVSAVNIAENTSEILSSDTGQLPAIPTIDTSTASTAGLTVTAPSASEGLGQVGSVATTQPNLGTAEAAQGTFTGAIDLDAMQGTLSEGAIAEAVTEELDPRATTSYQLGELFKSIEAGKPLPPWASPAVRRVSSIMNQRGLGGSSMAASAMTQAIMESGVPIAAKDADAYSRIQLTNITNKQKTALQNAVVTAQMDQINANNRMKGAIANAQGFLAMDIRNLDNQQKTNLLNFQADLQALFTDTAAENARRQFNAKNELQVEEFFAELSSQVEAANANRIANMNQFNVSQENSMEQFKIQVADGREKFNANMKFAIDQSNVQWRRQINTANTAVQNETNRINAQNAYNSSQASLNFLWQKMRDNAQFNFTNSESYLQKQHEIGLLAMEFANSQSLYNKKQRDLLALKIGEWVGNWIINSGGDE